jgi:hypothetical protein
VVTAAGREVEPGAFEDALRNGMPDDGKYHYMYMYSSPTMHFFKNIDTREYVQYNRIC